MCIPHFVCLLIYPRISGLLPPIGNNAAMNMGIQISVLVPAFISNIYPELELRDHTVTLCLIVLRNVVYFVKLKTCR